ncbi:MAG: flavin monoamine oxidase family protein [Bacteroidia bacterium]
MSDLQQRRDFIKTIAGASIGLGLGLHACTPSRQLISGSMLGAEAAIGHKIRDGFQFPKPSRTESFDTVIIGGGVSGLSAARALNKTGKDNFILLELGETAGGNARGGSKNGISFPWGAHYLPVPGKEQPELCALLEEFDVIYDKNEKGEPYFEERYLCHAPQERLLIQGRWQAGLLPRNGVPKKDMLEIEAFKDWVQELKYAVGSDGLPAFAIPLNRSSKDQRFRQWDQINLAGLIAKKGWSSPFLLWYLNYSCRDDFGGTIQQTSAWAGMHYFCSRRGGGANADSGDVLTWPEGNSWLTNRMAQQLGKQLRCNALVHKINNTEAGVELEYFDTKTHQTVSIKAQKAIFAGPQHVAARLIPDRKASLSLPVVPWVTANIFVKKPPTGLGAALSWDNVSYESESLGYVHANHQALDAFPGKERMLTWYHVLSEDDLLAARRRAAETSYSDWQHFVLKDLTSMHPKIQDDIQSLDLWIWGHGMTRPEPGFLTSEARLKAAEPVGNIHFAHTDLSGISIFEEAFYQGLRVAEEVGH